MVRTYIKKKTIRQADWTGAIKEVILAGCSVRSTATAFDVPRKSLARYCLRFTRDDVEKADFNFEPGTINEHATIFSSALENELREYLLRAASIYYGLSPIEVRKLAFQVALAHRIVVPTSWTANQLAGKDWFSGFLKRHQSISIRKPEATSLSRVSSFNPTNISSIPTIEMIRPFPKAPPRLNLKNTKRTRHTAIVTDTPEKDAIEERKNRTKENKHPVPSSSKKQRVKKKITVSSSSEEEDISSICLVCTEKFQNSRSREKWIKCTDCNGWAHEACTPGISAIYVCHHCDSE